MASVGEAGHYFPVGQVPADVTSDGSFVVFQVSPADSNILPVGGFMEKLGCQMGFGFFGFGNHQ